MEKKLCAVILAACCLLSMAGCRPSDVDGQNTIGLMELTDEQRQVLEAVSTEKESAYIFSVQAAYTDAAFWVETYRDGEKIETKPIQLEFHDEEGKAADGTFALVAAQGADTEWSLIYTGRNGAKIFYTGTVEQQPEHLASAGAALEPPCTIVDGQEIVLYARAFFSGTAVRAFGTQDFLSPDRLREFEYVQLLKCRFQNAP